MRHTGLVPGGLAESERVAALREAIADAAAELEASPRDRRAFRAMHHTYLRPAATAARGVDVSAFQHPGGAGIGWRSVARAGYRFAFIKSTEGTYYVNPYFKADLAGAEAAGLLVAAYHFANPASSGGAAQAAYALSHGAYLADGRMLRMILDIEPDPYLGKLCYGLSRRQLVSWIAAFMTAARKITGLLLLDSQLTASPARVSTRCGCGSFQFRLPRSDRLYCWRSSPATRRRH